MRHAEKATDDPRDPTLSADGQSRAQRVAEHLANAGLVAAYATPYRRTQLTAAPSAQAHGLQVTTYDPAQPAAAFASQLRAAHRTGTVLVVGHSNTIPALASALCECEAPALAETDFGRIYRLKVPAQGAATLELDTW